MSVAAMLVRTGYDLTLPAVRALTPRIATEMFYFADLNLTLNLFRTLCAPAKCVVPIVTHAYEECASERGKTLARFPQKVVPENRSYDQ